MGLSSLDVGRGLPQGWREEGGGKPGRTEVLGPRQWRQEGGVPEGRDVFSNRIISMYELTLGSSLAVCRVLLFSSPSAGWVVPGPQAEKNGPVLFMH